MTVRTAQEALALRPLTFLRSWWPWRSLAYLASGAACGAPVLGVLLGLFTTVRFVTRSPALAIVLPLVVLPLAAIPVARVERWRLRLVDGDPTHDPHRAVLEPGPQAWLRTRLREQVTWREVGFFLVCLLGLWWVDGALALAVVYPFVAPFAFGENPPQVLGLIAASALVLVVYAYLVSAWAGARGAITRAVLSPRDAELGERLTEVSRSRARLVDAFELERRRIERDLHDGAQQRLVALTMTLGLARLDTPDGTPLAAQIDAAHQQAKDALSELRELIRGVHPEVLTGRGLCAAVQDVAGRSVLPLLVDVELPRRLPPLVEVTAYFVVCEAIANSTRHAAATSVQVRARLIEDVLVVSITDDGAGGADPSRGTGLTGLVDRVAVLDGRLLLSSPPGGPTMIRAEIPCAQTAPSA
jgi:signal transduction histidine kinase